MMSSPDVIECYWFNPAQRQDRPLGILCLSGVDGRSNVRGSVTRELAVEGATMSSKSLHKKGYLWLTLAFFLISFGGHWLFAWSTYVREQTDHNHPVKIR